jgi:hypothetical protein
VVVALTDRRVLLATLAVVTILLLASCGLPPDRQFARLDFSHYASTSETYISSASASVGRYFTIRPEVLEAEAYVGVWQDLDAGEPYAMTGAGLTYHGPFDSSTSLTVEGFAPEDGGDLEYYTSLSVEVPWP